MSKTRAVIQMMQDLGLAQTLKEMLEAEPGFASAMGRGVNEHEADVLLDLLDLGWAIRTPISFLDKAGQTRLREILLGSDSPFGKRFVEILKKPAVDQVRLFTEYAIPPKDRAIVIQTARQWLLKAPALADDPKRLEQAVEDSIAAKYPAATLAEKVAARWTSRE